MEELDIYIEEWKKRCKVNREVYLKFISKVDSVEELNKKREEHYERLEF